MPDYSFAGMTYSSELYHYGIKGQKWGVRRYQKEDGTLTNAGKARYGKESIIDKKTARKLSREAARQERRERRANRKQKIQDAARAYKMSDKELLEKIGRLEREKRLMDLTYETLTTSGDPKKNLLMRSGKKVVENFIGGAGAYTLNTLTGNAFNPVAAAKAFNVKQFANQAFPNPNQKKK